MSIHLGQLALGRVWVLSSIWIEKKQLEVRKCNFSPQLHHKQGNWDYSVWAFLSWQSHTEPLHDAQGTKSAKSMSTG